jgi:hypothetical protein
MVVVQLNVMTFAGDAMVLFSPGMRVLMMEVRLLVLLFESRMELLSQTPCWNECVF